MRVLEERLLPGSLNAIWPSGPIPTTEPNYNWEGKYTDGLRETERSIPPRNSSIPPTRLISSSYFWHAVSKSGALPSNMWTFLGSISMWAKRCSCMNVWYDCSWSLCTPLSVRGQGAPNWVFNFALSKPRQVDVFVHVKGNNVSERQLTLLVHLNESLIGSYWAGAGGKA